MQQKNEPSYTEQPLFKADNIKKIEQTSVQSSKIDLYHLMELAGLAAWKLCEKYWQAAERITIVCGKGNNAGDGFVLARLAASQGRNVQVLLVDEKAAHKGDALTAYQLMLDQGIEPQKFDVCLLKEQQLIVDAILGTGLQGALRENYMQVIIKSRLL